MRRGATRGRVEAVTGEEPEARSRHAGIFRSPYPGIEIPEAPLTPFVLERAGELGDKPALVAGDLRRLQRPRHRQYLRHVAEPRP